MWTNTQMKSSNEFAYGLLLVVHTITSNPTNSDNELRMRRPHIQAA